MTVLHVAATLPLAATFGVAGTLKLADLGGSRAALGALGFPPNLASAVGTVLPFLEVLLAIALLIPTTRSWAAVGAVLVLAVFVVFISARVAQGESSSCHCFGKLGSGSMGWHTVLP